MKILVTGGLGVVGRPLVERLVRHGHSVRIMDRTSEGCVAGAECVVGDVTDYAALREQVRGMEAVVHLAALTHPAAGAGQEIFRLNCTGTYNAYEAAAQEGIRRVVCASSINALGFNFGVKHFPIQYFPVDEAHPTCTTDAYSFSKQVTEEIAAYYCRREGISGVQLRLPFVYPVNNRFRDMLQTFMTQTRQAVQAFIEMSDAERRAQAQRVVAEREKGRAQRWNEKPWDQRGDGAGWFDRPDPMMLIAFSYTDFWSAIDGQDSAQAFEKGITAEYEGSHPLFVCEDQNTLGIPSELLVKTFYPDAMLKRPLAGAENLVSFEQVHQLLGFTPQHHIGEWLNQAALNAKGPGRPPP